MALSLKALLWPVEFQLGAGYNYSQMQLWEPESTSHTLAHTAPFL